MKFFRVLPYILSIVILKPILTWFLYPKFKDWYEDGIRYVGKHKEYMGFHIDQYFVYHIETFLYALILVVLVYSIVNYKKLTRKQ